MNFHGCAVALPARRARTAMQAIVYLHACNPILSREIVQSAAVPGSQDFWEEEPASCTAYTAE